MNLFGFTITRTTSDTEDKKQSFIVPQSDDGASTVQAGGYYGTYVDLDASARTESDLITKYREIAMYPDCANAIEEIVGEAIAAVDNETPVDINLDSIDDKEIPPAVKEKIQEEFSEVLRMLNFNDKGYEIFKRWYIDGRLFFQKVIDVKNIRRGVIELRQIDPRKIKKVRDIKKKKLETGIEVVDKIDEYYVYSDTGLIQKIPNFTRENVNNQGIKIAPDSIAYVPSGVMDLEKMTVLSYLHKAIKPANQLKMMEDSLVIYRLSRAPERRVFYIDVGNLPKIKAEQYLKDIMTRYRNKIVYDSATGEVRDDRKFMTMLEDFWLPRREGGRGTEITTLPGGENLGQIDDIEYFQNKLYQALDVPLSRLQPQTGIQFGRAAEITRDELRFSKFVDRLRKKFNELFNDILKSQLILKGILVESDWDRIAEKINYQYAEDQFFKEMKDAENLRNRIDVLNQIQPYVGTYYSKNFVMRNVLRLSDDEIDNMKDEMTEEAPEVEEMPPMGGGAPAPQPQQPGGPQNGQ
jgi:hypothetical protein